MKTIRTRFMLVALALPAYVVTSTFFGCMLTATHTKHVQEMKQGLKQEIQHTEESLAMRCDTEKDIMKKLLIGDLEKTRSELGDELTIYKSVLTRLLGEQVSEKQLQSIKISQLERMRTAMQKRTEDYQQLIDKLNQMQVSGALQVKFRKGLMAVQLPSDILFTGNGVAIKAQAREALVELAQTLASFSGRHFQVVGHSDDRPVRTRRYTSNWELSTQRAVQVVKTLVKAGVKPELISAAGAAHFDPISNNESPEGRMSNRRVEIIFVPKMDELPAQEVAQTQAQDPKTPIEAVPPMEIVPIKSAKPADATNQAEQSNLAKTAPAPEQADTATTTSTAKMTPTDSSAPIKSTTSAMSSTSPDP